MNNPKIVRQNSVDTVVNMPSRRLSRACDTSSITNCSQQSILNAIERFVKSVENMDSTVLVPSKLRDMDISKITSCNVNARRKTSQCKAPTILHNTDLYAFYQMLHDIKKDLMWGPSSGMSAIASSGFSQSSSSINNICNSSMSNNSSFNTNSSVFSNFGSNYNIGNNQITNLNKFANSTTINSSRESNLVNLPFQMNHASSSMMISNHPVNSSVNSSTISTVSSSTSGNSSAGSTNSHHSSSTKYLSKDLREKHHSRQPSDDSSVSLGSAASTLDIDSESEVDSVLADRESSNSSSSQTSDEHTLHLAAAFKHHLQGLHQILDTLTNTADFFGARYQEEVDELTEH